MRMIIRIVSIHRRRARILIQLRSIQSMICKRRSRRLRRIARIRHEAARAVREGPCLLDIIGRCAADDYVGAFGGEQFGCVVEVGVVCLYGFGGAAGWGVELVEVRWWLGDGEGRGVGAYLLVGG